MNPEEKENDNKKFEESFSELNSYVDQLKKLIGERTEEEMNFDYDELLSNFGITMKEVEDSFKMDTTKIPLPFKKLHPDAVSPKYNYDTDSGFDFHSIEEVVIPAMGRALIPTGLSFDIKDGYEIQVRSKSGLAINQGIMCLNSPGTVDSGYMGEIKVIIFNTNMEPFVVKKGMKVAQGVFCPVVNGRWIQPVEKEELTKKDRNDNGFGSTGI